MSEAIDLCSSVEEVIISPSPQKTTRKVPSQAKPQKKKQKKPWKKPQKKPKVKQAKWTCGEPGCTGSVYGDVTFKCPECRDTVCCGRYFECVSCDLPLHEECAGKKEMTYVAADAVNANGTRRECFWCGLVL